MENEKNVEVLNDLIQINNDRIAGYQKAIEELKDDKDGDLKSLFTEMVNESQRYNTELAQQVGSLGGKVAEGSSLSGKIYRTWMDVKALFTGGDRKTVLDNCENGEDAAQRAYTSALDEEGLLANVHELIMTQKASLLEAHNKIKALRDAE